MKSKSTYFRVFISVRGPVLPSVFLSVFNVCWSLFLSVTHARIHTAAESS